MRLIEEVPDKTSYWTAETYSPCPECQSSRPRKVLKMITYEEATLRDFIDVPTAVLALEFLWLYMAEFNLEETA